MIKFFRKIRQQLLTENPSAGAGRAGKLSKPASRTGRYLLYAMGEILLVVVGILIALQINNANEYKKLERVELGYLKRLLIDLEKDQQLWTRTIELRNSQLGAIKKIEEIAFFKPDSSFFIMENIPKALEWEKLNPHVTTYNEMLSGGNLDLIKDDSIKINLLELDAAYNTEIDRMTNIQIEHNNVMDAFREIVSFKNLASSIRNAELPQPKEIDTINYEIEKEFKLLANDKRFINNLIGLEYNYENQLETINDLKIQAEQLFALIQTEITNRMN